MSTSPFVRRGSLQAGFGVVALILIGALALANVDTVRADPPPMPSSFYGEIHMIDSPPAVGSVIEAYLPGVTPAVASANIVEYGENLVYSINVPGGTDGALVTFKIASRVVLTAPWHAGTNTLRNIHPPQAALSTDEVDEASPATLDAAASTDWGSDIATYAFNCDTNPDYEIGPQAGSTTQCTFPDDGSYTVGVLVNDNQGGQGSAAALLTVNNVAPSAIFTAPSVNEGQAIPLSLTGATDPSGPDQIAGFEYAFDCGLGYSDWSSTATTSCPTTDDGPHLVKGALRDKDLGLREYPATVTINDVVPIVDAGGPYTATAGQPLTLDASVTCASVDLCTYAWDLDEDGSYDDSSLIDPTHTWTETGNFTLSLSVSDGDGSPILATATLTVSAATHGLTLVPGWNLVSFNIHPANPATGAVLSSITGSYDLVYAWDAATQNWLKYDPIEASPDNLINLTEEQGFWIHITAAENVTLQVTGSLPSATDIHLNKTDLSGWNLVGFPALNNSSLPGALSAANGVTDFSLVYAYHATEPSEPWKLYDNSAPEWANDLKQLSPGWGYWVQVDTASDWHVEYQ